MAEKEHQFYPVELNQGQAKTDVESATAHAKELRKKKRIACLSYIAAFAVFQTIIILLFAFTVMRIKSPKYRIRSVAFEDLTYSSNTTTSPSFNMKFTAELGVKNTNFGHFKFEDSTIEFTYRGAQVGQAFVSKARARARSTKKMSVNVDLSSVNDVSTNSLLGSDIKSGVLTLSSHSKLSGKVHLMKVFKKKKSAEMNCTMTISLAEKAIQYLKCN